MDMSEFFFEREQEKFEHHDFSDQAYQEWPEINSLPQEEIQEDQMVEFSAEQDQLFQRRLEEKHDLPDPVYQQWLKIHYPTAEP